jgi:predicted transcriptional regulator
MDKIELHKAQAAVLYGLRHVATARFSDLMRLTGLTSDDFKFHVRRLVALGYLEKIADGQYMLTALGKEFANNLDTTRRTVQKQPKLSVLLIVPEPGARNPQRYLFHQRKRNPYLGFWSYVSGPVRWGEEVEVAAARELTKQTGLMADFTVCMFYRQRDYDKAGVLLEDKLFTVLEASNVAGQLTNMWHGGVQQWMTIDELKNQDKYFEPIGEIFQLVAAGIPYASRKVTYGPGEY